VNISTQERTWAIPTSPAPSIRRKPVPYQSDQVSIQRTKQYQLQEEKVVEHRMSFQLFQNQISPSVAQKDQLNSRNYPASPPQYQPQTTGYFPPPPAHVQYESTQSLQQQIGASGHFASSVNSQFGSPIQIYPIQEYPPPPVRGSYQPQQQSDIAQPAAHSIQQYPPPLTHGSYQPQQ
jgi:hypothetical protein